MRGICTAGKCAVRGACAEWIAFNGIISFRYADSCAILTCQIIKLCAVDAGIVWGGSACTCASAPCATVRFAIGHTGVAVATVGIAVVTFASAICTCGVCGASYKFLTGCIKHTAMCIVITGIDALSVAIDEFSLAAAMVVDAFLSCCFITYIAYIIWMIIAFIITLAACATVVRVTLGKNALCTAFDHFGVIALAFTVCASLVIFASGAKGIIWGCAACCVIVWINAGIVCFKCLVGACTGKVVQLSVPDAFLVIAASSADWVVLRGTAML